MIRKRRHDRRGATPVRTGSGHSSAHDVVIIGGGNAGISLAARLQRDGARDVAVIDPVDTHRYSPLLSYVAGGQATLAELERPQARVIPAGVHWYQDRVTKVEPLGRVVHTAGGSRITGDDLVVCPGVEPDWDAVPGSREAVYSAHGGSNYVAERAVHIWDVIHGLRSGKAVFAVSDGTVPCAGAALKPLFLAADHWRRSGRLAGIEITAVVGWDTIFGIDRVDAELQSSAQSLGIRVITNARIDRIDPAARTLDISTPDEQLVLDYDLIHYAPRHRAPSWIAESDLAGVDTDGMVEISPSTLAHRRHPAVWGLGDAADVQASRSGGALRKQAAVVAENIALDRKGRPLISYDGYSTAPITVGQDRLVLAEFDRAYRITPSVPVIDLIKPRRLTRFYDRHLQPLGYWHQILKGRVSS